MAPTIIYEKGHSVTVPIRFLPVQRIQIEGDDVFNIKYDSNNIYCDVKISSQSRGWDYDYRNYRYTPKIGNGDIRTITTAKYYRDGMYGVDFDINDVTGDIYVEILPKLKSLEQRGTFV